MICCLDYSRVLSSSTQNNYVLKENCHMLYPHRSRPCASQYFTEVVCVFGLCSVIYNDEFSSRLSVAALMRLRAAALQAVDADVNTPSALLPKLARNFFNDANETTSLINLQPQFSGAQRSETLRNDSLQGESAGSSDNPAREHAQSHRSKSQ